MKIHHSLKSFLAATTRMAAVTFAAGLAVQNLYAETYSYYNGDYGDYRHPVDVNTGSNVVTFVEVQDGGAQVYGAYAEYAEYEGEYGIYQVATGNSVYLYDSSLDSVYGGYSEYALAGSNSVYIMANSPDTGSSRVAGNVIGGSATYTNDSVEGDAPWVSMGFASGNYVSVDNASVGGHVIGGETRMGYSMPMMGMSVSGSDSNWAVLHGASVGGDVVGGTTALDSTTASNNIVEVSADSAVEGSVYGGQVQNGSMAEAIYNKVTVTDSTVAMDVYGAKVDASSGQAYGNEVTVTNSTVEGDVYGAASIYYSSNNIVTLEGSTVKGNVYGGASLNWDGIPNGESYANEVVLKSLGDHGDLSAAEIYGGVAMTTSGHTLTLDGFKGEVAGVHNFDTVNFVLDGWEAGATILTINGTDSILDSFTLNINFTAWNAEVEADGQMTLIAGLSAANLANWTYELNGAAAFSTETPFDVQLVQQDSGLWNLIAFVPSTEPDAPGTETIPEPATATLSLLGLAALAMRRRRK